MNLQHFETQIDARVTAWTTLPAPLLRDTVPSQKRDVLEYIRMIVIHGDGFVDEGTGIRSVGGTNIQNPFILRFDVFTDIKAGMTRSNLLVQAVKDHWQVRSLSGFVYLDAANDFRIGEESKRFHRQVDIPGAFTETLIKRDPF